MHKSMYPYEPYGIQDRAPAEQASLNEMLKEVLDTAKESGEYAAAYAAYQAGSQDWGEMDLEDFILMEIGNGR